MDGLHAMIFALSAVAGSSLLAGATWADYLHYRERQLAPAADGILHFLDTTFDQITDTQLRFF